MSEAVRTYNGSLHRRPRRVKSGGGRRALIVLGVIVVLVGYGWWTTRDTYSPEQLLPADVGCHITANRMLENRDSVAASQVWATLPERFRAGDVRRALTYNMGMPEWVLNNLLPETCHLAANDLKQFSDVLLVSRMTRFGCFIERIYRHLPGVEEDWAGGLHLRRMRKNNLYYAVRGRALAVSKSRDNLIKALTLRPEDAIKKEDLAAAVERNMDSQFWGSLNLASDDPMGNLFEHINYKLKVEPDGAVLSMQASLRQELKDMLGDNFKQLRPRRLIAPPDGILKVSADFGMPLADVWNLPGKNAVQQWLTVERTTDKQSLLSAVAGLIGPMGPGMRVAWRGMDLNQIVPMPQLVGIFDMDPGTIPASWESLPDVPQIQPLDHSPRYDAAKQRLQIPILGDMRVIAMPYGDAMFAAIGDEMADNFLAQPVQPKTLTEHGNLYIEIRPRECIKAVCDTAMLLSEAQLLRNQTPESVQQWAKPLMEQTSNIKSATLTAACGENQLDVQIRFTCAQ